MGLGVVLEAVGEALRTEVDHVAFLSEVGGEIAGEHHGSLDLCDLGARVGLVVSIGGFVLLLLIAEEDLFARGVRLLVPVFLQEGRELGETSNDVASLGQVRDNGLVSSGGVLLLEVALD